MQNKERPGSIKCPKCNGEGFVWDPNFKGPFSDFPRGIMICPNCKGRKFVPAAGADNL